MQLDTSQAVRYHDGKFPPTSLDYGRLMPALLEATDALARYDQALKTLHNSEIFLAPLRNQEALVSSRMEGTISTMDEIMQLDAAMDDDADAAQEYRSEVVETLLYQRALRTAQLQMQDGRPLTTSLLKSIHQQLLSFGRGASKTPGSFKTAQNYIGELGRREVSYMPIAPEKLETGMEALMKFIGHKSVPILLRTALSHVEFEALHPFQDGNGRIGRMLITLMLWDGGAISAPHFYISRFFEDHKAAYIRLMREVSADEAWEAWTIFFLEAVKAQAIGNLQIAEAIRSLYEEMKGRFAEVLNSKWSLAVLDFVFTYPIFPNSRFTHRSPIPAQTAARFSRLLLEADLLEVARESAGRRSAVYRFEPLMKILRV